MIKAVLERVASKIKGAPFSIDPGVPLTALIELASRRLAYAFRGMVISRTRPGRVFAASGVTLRNRGLISFGTTVTLGHGVLVDGLSQRGVRFGSNVNVGPMTIIQGTGVISNLGSGCSIGNNSGIGGFSFIGAGGGVDIGSDVIMGQYVSFHSENHVFESMESPIRLQGVVRKGIVVEDDCWIGAKVTFLDGTHIGRGCVVAAGAVVSGDFPSYSVIGGVPARILRSRRSVASDAS